MWPKSGLIGDKNMVMGESGYRGIRSFGGGCGSMGARRPFVVCNDQLLHFWIVQSSGALSGSHRCIGLRQIQHLLPDPGQSSWRWSFECNEVSEERWQQGPHSSCQLGSIPSWAWPVNPG